ncbi:ArsR family transcriptional regulator [Halanaerobium saccharolyticum]|uniref:ArsR family transcriptional regulator n=1 Tax=Halanaerobium saccharolyticum TaxID=43595 RepID=A0A4R7Z7M2_9FIRM|nr:metalloregulator ArsR/SmtB family transcription factor [Halanaerobium saccharolyticum]RAK04211.1 ArsR family transcriptional regulator [Halanaerobium saccharolyticum]TDW06766.1 ArsR family transcriptional regulator [Halanaerobium saccharolyticum]TDX62401.1 ArsR family transcriptional regulator [Halanaerobium saccharolyticum]
MEITEVLKALAHENRIRILNLLAGSELCVCELENIMQVTQSNASRHLSKLKQVDLIKGRKRAQWIYYSLNQDLLAEHKFLKNLIEEEIKDWSVAKEDKLRLEKYNASSLSCETLPDSNIFED